MEHKRSIQDIIPPARSKPIRSTHHAESAEGAAEKRGMREPSSKPPRPPTIRQGNGKGMFGIVTILVAVVLVVIVAFAVVSIFFHRANVTITLKTFTVPVAESFEASVDGVLLPFTNRTVEETLSKTVPRSGSEYVEERASGTITVFNAYSKSSQRLITNTRFESPDGLIYRIKNSVVVPGYTSQSDGTIVPGKIEVTVYADSPGEQYNIGIVDFTIPGLSGTEQFKDMYARSVTAMSGGFVGEQAVVSPEVRDAALNELRSEIDRKIRSSVEASMAEGEVFFLDTVAISVIEQPDRTVEGGALVTLKAVATVPVFSEEKLARAIAQEGGVSYESPLTIENEDALAIRTEPSEVPGNIRLTLSGEAKLVGAYSKEGLIRDLVGKDRRNVGVVLSGYPAIADMKISVYPFWRGRLPESPERFEIAVVESENPQ